MIQQLVDALRGANLDLTSEEIADALWFAFHIGPYAKAAEEQPITVGDDTAAKIRLPAPTGQHTPQAPASESTHHESAAAADRVSAYAQSSSMDKASSAGTMTGLTFKSPGASALPGAIDLARSLRPLMRKFQSRKVLVLDEEATVRRIVDENIWMPVLRPGTSRRFEVALVIDDNPSMVIWEQTVQELRQLLEHHGAFYDVRVWRVSTDGKDGHARLLTLSNQTLGQRRWQKPHVLVNSGGQRIILIVSDCVSQAWHNGSVSHMLSLWGRTNPVAIVQLLPEHLWSRTALGSYPPVRLSASAVGMPNAQLEAKTTEHWVEEDAAAGLITKMPVPIVTLEPHQLGNWAKMVAGQADAVVPGRVMEGHSNKQTITRTRQGKKLLDAVHAAAPIERVYRFWSTASPMARKLASLLAVVPISIPIIRVVQHSLLPESRQVHLAEVFLGGLLQETGHGNNHDSATYDFVDGVRDLLLDTVSVSDSLRVLNEVSSYVESRFGQSLDFQALLADPTTVDGIPIAEGSIPFAAISFRVLRRMGGKYKQLAERLERKIEQAGGLSEATEAHAQEQERYDDELPEMTVELARDWDAAEQLLRDGGITRCKVIGFNKGGLLVQFNRIRGFVPASQVSQYHGRTATEERQQALQKMVNQQKDISLKVIEADRTLNRLVLSERSATQEWRKVQKQRLLRELQPGDVLSGHVNQLTNFGAFIDLGGADGLVHISELSWRRVNHPREVLQPDQEVKVMVIEIDHDRERIGLSIRRLLANPWETIHERFRLDQIVRGPVTNITPFGAFVQIEEAVEGLIHSSELDIDPYVQPHDMLQPGQMVTAKVISLDAARQRIGLSLRRMNKAEEQVASATKADVPAAPEAPEAEA